VISWLVHSGETRVFNAAWRDAIGRGRGWKTRAAKGREDLIAEAPDLNVASLWRTE